jgi:DNA replication protein DnaC
LLLAEPAISTAGIEGAGKEKPAISTAGTEGAGEAEPAISTAGVEGTGEAKPAISTAGKSIGRRSQCEPLAEAIMAKVEVGLSAQRMLARRHKSADFREPRSLENFDFSFNPSIKRAQIYELAAAQFVRQHRDVLLVGPPGVGKSHLVQAIGLEVLKAGFVVLYRSIFDLVRELLTQETMAGEARLLNKYLKPDLLVIDDMGLKILPAKSGEILLEIIMRRYENRSTMMTSNRPIEEWGKLLSDVPAAGAILDRLLHHAEIIPITGRSYRLQPTKNNRNS